METNMQNANDYPSTDGIEVVEISERREDFVLRRLILTGSLMADRLRNYDRILEHLGEPDETERGLISAWESLLEDFRQARKGVNRGNHRPER